MKFGEVFNEYLHGEQEKFLNKCSHVEYKKLKKVLKTCRICEEKGEDDGSCPLCDHEFFDELAKEASEISGCFISRARHLVHRHGFISLRRHVWCLKQCFPDKQDTVFQEGKMLLDYVTVNAIAVRKILKKYDKELVFRPHALSCGHLFCKGCACSAASLLYFEDLKLASPEAKCPVCRAVGVYAKSIHMVELDFLLKKRCPEYWKERKSAERVEFTKQSREYWNMQTGFMIGF